MDDVLNRTNYKILIFATAPNEAWEMKELLRFYDNPRVAIADQNYVFSETRGLIAGAYACITMKHHPIVFSIGECVPVISFTATDYFNHKNLGALSLFGLERFSIDFNDSFWEQRFIQCFEEIELCRNEITCTIQERLKELEIKNHRFEERIIDIYDNSASVVDAWNK